MKKMGKQFIAGTALAVTAISSAALLSGCFPFGPSPSVYGPPPDPTETSTTYEPNPPVYGPPEYFEPESEINEDVYGPPEYFEPESEINEDVYGPPEDMETGN